MTSIRRIAPQNCPNCGSKNTLFIADDRRLTCRLCGYKAGQTADDTIQPETPSRPKARYSADRVGITAETLTDYLDQFSISYGTPYTPQVNRWAKTIYHSALDALQQGDYDQARRDFLRAAEQQNDFVDAWLWLARLTLDPQARHDYYSHVLAQQPNHLEATRELMVLSGEISRAEATRSAANTDYPLMAEAELPVATRTISIQCSNCGGTLQANPDQQTIICEFCGHVEDVAGHDRGYGMQMLSMAMIKERSKRIQWKVGEHLLRCDNCGAERIITGKMSSECPFCGSNQVVQTDALQSFQQPDGIVPFAISHKPARAALDDALGSLFERFKGLFVNNAVERIQLTPVYLPFWLFDVTAQITRTMRERENRTPYSRFTPPQVTRDEFTESDYNIPVAGVESPPRALTRKLKPYDLAQVKPYDAKLLAKASAELYSMDFMDASMQARRQFRQYVEQRHKHDVISDKEITISSLVQNISFRLVMLPVWSATIFEKDADVRLALIHGQTGDVVLGKAHTPG